MLSTSHALRRPSEGLVNAMAAAGGGDGDEEGQGMEAASAAGSGGASSGDELAWAYTSDNSVSFPVDCVVQGDLLVSKFVRGVYLGGRGDRSCVFVVYLFIYFL